MIPDCSSKAIEFAYDHLKSLKKLLFYFFIKNSYIIYTPLSPGFFFLFKKHAQFSLICRGRLLTLTDNWPYQGLYTKHESQSTMLNAQELSLSLFFHSAH